MTCPTQDSNIFHYILQHVARIYYIHNYLKEKNKTTDKIKF